MKKFSFRALSAVLSVCMIITMISCLFAVSASADNVTYDSGNMPTWVFDADSWNTESDIIAKNMSDKSLRFYNTGSLDFGTDMTNRTITFDLKSPGDWAVYLRTNADRKDGYMVGYDGGYIYIKRIIDTCTVTEMCGSNFDLFNPMQWYRFSITFEDTDSYTSIELKIDGKPVPLYDYATFADGTFKSLESYTSDRKTINGKYYDFDPIRDSSMTNIAFEPAKSNGRVIINRLNALYIRSVDTDLSDAVDPYRITFIGDSITHGALVKHDQTWSHYMNELLGYSYDCYNGGVSAAAAFEGAGYGFPYRLQNQFTYTGNMKSDLVVIMLGTNDAKYIKDYNTNVMFTGDNLEKWHQKFITDYSKIVNNCDTGNAQFIFVMPPWNYHDEWTDEIIRKMGEWVTELATMFDAKLYNMYETTYQHESWFDDKLHPNKTGYQEMAAAFYAWLTEESGIDLTKSDANKVALAPTDNSAFLAEHSTPLTKYNGSFNKNSFIASCSGGWSSIKDNEIRYIDGGVGSNGGGISTDIYNLGIKWTTTFTFQGTNGSSPEIVNGEYKWSTYRYSSYHVGGLEFKIYHVKDDNGNVVLAYRLFMNNVEITDPCISKNYYQTNSYTINYSFGSIKIVRNTDNYTIFDIGSSNVGAVVGENYRFDGVRLALSSYEYNVTTIWSTLSVVAQQPVESEYDITHNENGHIEVNGKEFDATSARYIDERIILNAVCDTYGYMFIKWTDGDGNKLSTDPSYDVKFTDQKTVLRAVFGPFAAYSDLQIKATEGGSILFNGAPYNYNDDYIVGDIVELTAVPNAGYEFGYWMDANGNVASTDAVWNVKLTNVSDYTAVFFSTGSDKAVVLFYGRAGKAISTCTVAVGSNVTLPELPFSYGYVCNGWNVNGTVMAAGEQITINENTIISAVYSKASKKYTVQVNGGTVNGTSTSDSFSYNTKITVVFDQSILNDGEKFYGWHIADSADDNSIISYETSYTFYVGANVSLVAVVNTAAAEAKPISDITDVSLIDGGKKVSFLTERTLPAGYTLIKSGIIYTADSNKAAELTLDNLGGTVFALDSKSVNTNGQLRLTVASRDGSAITVYAVSYLVYFDKAGNKYTIYSNVHSGTTVSHGGSQEIIEDVNDRF